MPPPLKVTGAASIWPQSRHPSPVTLKEIKEEPSLAGISLIKQSRLSVMPVTAKEFGQILKLGGL